MEIWISRLLLSGVLLSAAIILAGFILFLLRGGIGGESLSDVVDRQKTAADFGMILRGISRADGKSLIQLGLLVLILTPISRVAMSVFFFLRERDRVFVATTAIVLCILVGGLIGSAFK
ncbi:MAG: DUF1634 domain-containing protein [Acidobacteria bacterium]|nr:DUF1634 domain-containing protein [Acidobacteriota bacterium]